MRTPTTPKTGPKKPMPPTGGAVFRLLGGDDPLAAFATRLLDHIIDRAVKKDHDFVLVAQVLANLTGKILAIGLHDVDGGPRFVEIPPDVRALLGRLIEAGFELELEALGGP